MTDQSAKYQAVITRLYAEANDGRRYELVDELCQPDIVVHDPLNGESRGAEAYRGLLAFFGAAFPEQRTELQQFVIQGDWLAVLHIHHAVNTGAFVGLPPTGRTVHVPGIELYRFDPATARIAEFWRFDADLSLMQQLGAIPAPAAA